jgi:diguanylate cyclase (GGDEF)-like protein/PAS domain S-box-containing protein
MDGDQHVSVAADDGSRWRIALESAEAGVWYYDVERGNETASDHWYVMRGLDPVLDIENGYRFWTDRLHPDDVDRMQQFIARMNKGELPDLSAEYRERHADGRYIWILCRGKTVFDADGKPVRFVGTDTDITALKNTELELRQVSHRFSLAVSASKVGAWEFDITTQTIWWDQNTRELFGVAAEGELSPEVWAKRLHPEDRSQTEKASREAIESDCSYAFDYRIVLDDGRVRHVRSRFARFVDQSKGPKLVGLNWDVTEDYTRAAELQTAKLLAEQRAEELEAARLKMEYGALHDALTGLPNRRQLDKKLDSIGGRGRVKLAERVAILHVDLDRFKEINDSLGHLAGDVTLQRAANILRDCAPQRALVSRAGGDEFIVIIDGAPNDESLGRIAGDIIGRMQEPIFYAGQECSFGASIGIAVATVGSLNGRQLLQKSDLALYQAKEQGRNRYCFFTAEMDTQANARKNFADDIRSGIEGKAFFPIYQPQFDAKSLDIIGVEVLARWQHPTRGVLTPVDFMQVAQELNVLGRIDEMVISRASLDVSAWRQAGVGIKRLAFNLAPEQLANPRITELLHASNFSGVKIAIDLQTTSDVVDGGAAAVNNLAALRGQGVELEVADFGCGRASIDMLMELRPERLKVATSLLKDIQISVEQRRLGNAIVSMGKALGIEVMAVGVERPDHVGIFRNLGCDVLQGYGLAVPMVADVLTAFVKKQGWRKVA